LEPKTKECSVVVNRILWPGVAAVLGFLYALYDFASGRNGEIFLPFNTATTICLLALSLQYSRRAGAVIYELSVLALSVGNFVGSHPELYSLVLYGWMINASIGGVILWIPRSGRPGLSSGWRRLRIGSVCALVLQAGLVTAGFAQILLIEKRPYATFRALGNPLLESIGLSTDGNTLATVGGFGPQLKTARLWDAQTGRELAEIGDTKVAGDPRFAGLHFLGDRLALAIRADGRTSIAVFDVEKHEVTARFEWADEVYGGAAVFSRDGTQFVYGNSGGHVRVFDLNVGKLTVTLLPNSGQATCLAVSRSNGKVACATRGNAIELWDLCNSDPIGSLFPAAGVECIDFSADGRLVACGTDTATVEVFDVTQLHRIMTVHCFGDGIVSAVAFSPDGEILACGGSRGVTVLVDPESGETRGKLRMWGAWEVRRLSFSPGGKRLATGNLRGDIAIWQFD
jgi:WD40 repeat protein